MYLGLPTPAGETGLSFDPTPHTFSVGTNPIGIAVGNLNSDTIPDVVVTNEGSNDISILFGQGQDSNWTLVSGPRYPVGQGPTAVAIEGTAAGVPELVVTNSGGHTLSVLPGVGTQDTPTGFFDAVGHGGFTVALPNPAPVPLPQPIPTPLPPTTQPGHDYISLANGGLALVTSTLIPQIVFTPPVGLLPTSFAFDATGQFLFVGTDGGGIDVFQADANGVYSEPLATIPSQADLQDISEMAVVAEDSSQFQLYVTNVGEDNPVVVTLQIHLGSLPGAPEPSPSPLPTPPAPERRRSSPP